MADAADHAALEKLFGAHQELKRLGWNDAIYTAEERWHPTQKAVAHSGLNLR